MRVCEGKNRPGENGRTVRTGKKEKKKLKRGNKGKKSLPFVLIKVVLHSSFFSFFLVSLFLRVSSYHLPLLRFSLCSPFYLLFSFSFSLFALCRYHFPLLLPPLLCSLHFVCLCSLLLLPCVVSSPFSSIVFLSTRFSLLFSFPRFPFSSFVSFLPSSIFILSLHHFLFLHH